MSASTEQAQLSAQNNELAAHGPDGGAIGLTEIGDRLEVGGQPPGQPHQFDVALGLTLKPPARLDPVQIPVKVDLEHRRRMIGWTPRISWRHSSKPQRLQIQRVDESLDRPTRIVLRHIIIKR